MTPLPPPNTLSLGNNTEISMCWWRQRCPGLKIITDYMYRCTLHPERLTGKPISRSCGDLMASLYKIPTFYWKTFLWEDRFD